jgi:serine phosphatase RsbU (regulator of sigma subunit)
MRRATLGWGKAMIEFRAGQDDRPTREPGVNGRMELSADARWRLLLEISHSVRGTLDLRETLDRLLDGVFAIVPYDAAGIFVLDGEVAHSHPGPLAQRIAGVSWRGFTPRSPRTDPMLREGKGIVGYVIRTGEAVCAADVRVDHEYIQAREATRSEVAVPIQLDGRTIGALNLESDRLAAFHAQDVDVLSFFAQAAAIAVEKAMLHERLIEAERMERRLKIAQQVQERLLPGASPRIPGHEVAGVCIPSARVGGDYFDYIPLADGQLGIVVADVSGHDLPAALVMSAFRALVRTCLRAGHALDEVARTLNRELPDTTGDSSFVTALLGVLDPVTGHLRYVNCGHNPPLHEPASGARGWLDRGGPPLGVMERATFDIGTVELAPGDQLVIYTDGLTEARNPAGEWFGADRLVDLVLTHKHRAPRELVERVVFEVRGFTGVGGFEDDVTLVVLRRER